MSWFKKIAYVDLTKIINDVLINKQDIGWASTQLKSMAPLPGDVCEIINRAANLNAAARSKMQVLAQSGGCQWSPEQLLNPQNEQPMNNDLWQQEQMNDMPSIEIE